MNSRQARSSIHGLLAWFVFAAGCAAGGESVPALDTGHGDTVQQPDHARPDMSPADTHSPDTKATPMDAAPDKKPPKDTGPKPDVGLCGNGKVDSPGETCDRAIKAGAAGACPTLAGCNDKNKCTVDTLNGSASKCTAKCANTPISVCCGNGAKEPGEECDDGNVVDKDGCTNLCKLPGGHLLITEVASSPSGAEFVEIYNPGSTSMALDQIYLADRNDYFLVTTGAFKGVATDFVARFPSGASIGPGKYVVVAIQGALNFKIAYGKTPDYELKSTDITVADMVAPTSKAIGSLAGLTDAGELVVMFTWNGASDLIKDVDYIVWKGSAATAVYKSTTICVDGIDSGTLPSCFLDDTSVLTQSYLIPASQGGSLHRCNYLEGAEKKSAGNGQLGHDETSEPFAGTGATWKRNPKTLGQRTPGGPAPVNFCPQ